MKIRFADIEDAEDLFRWRTDPVTMKFSLSEDKISMESHLEWFNKALADKSRVILIAVLEDGEKAGMIRFDEKEDGKTEISIAVSPEMRGRGIGTSLLELGCRTHLNNWDKKSIFATIKKVNEISIKIFTRCGFENVKEDDQNVYMELRR